MIWCLQKGWEIESTYSHIVFVICFCCLNFDQISPYLHKVVDLSPIHFWKLSAPDGTYGSKYWWNQGLALIQGQIYNPATKIKNSAAKAAKFTAGASRFGCLNLYGPQRFALMAHVAGRHLLREEYDEVGPAGWERAGWWQMSELIVTWKSWCFCLFFSWWYSDICSRIGFFHSNYV